MLQPRAAGRGALLHAEPLTLHERTPISGGSHAQWDCPRALSYDTNGTEMANTKSAKKATRKIKGRTEVNQGRRSRMRTFVRGVEDAIKSGDKAAAVAALQAAEPVLVRAAQKGVVHKRTASRKVSRLSQRVAKLGQ